MGDMRRRPSPRSAVLVTVVAASAVLLVGCGSDGITRPTLPNRTTVPSSEPGATTPPVDTTVPAPDTTVPSTPEVTEPVATVPPTNPPATPAPTNPPATPAPTTAPPATAAPTTAAPTTPAAPTTEAPTTEAPTTVPATDAVTTVPVTEPATTVDSIPGESDGDGGTTWWPWVLLAVLAVGGLTALALRRRGPKWPQKVSGVLDELDGITAHLSAHTPEGLRTVAQADAAALAALRVRLRDLVASASDDGKRAALDALTAPVAELHTAVGAVSLSPTIPTADEHQAVVRAAAVVNTTSATARLTIVPPPPPPAPPTA